MAATDSINATTMMAEIDNYIEKYGINPEGKNEMLEILNKSLIMISYGILETKNTKEIKKESIPKGKETVKSNEGANKFKSKKAEEYAHEHNLTLDDFNIAEVSKKDVENKVREMTKVRKDTGSSITSKTSSSSAASSSTSSLTPVKKSKEKVICSGINKKGECCKSVGTIQPDGAKKKYCFRHAEDFRSFECESDSSECEEEEELLPNNLPICQSVNTENKEKDSDDELFEED